MSRTRSYSSRARFPAWLLPPLLLLGACGPDQATALLGSEGDQAEFALVGPAGAQRAAYIARVQANAPFDAYALRLKGEAPQKPSPSALLNVSVGDLVTLTMAAGETLSLHWAGYGCEGSPRPVPHAPPVLRGNRAEYSRRGAFGEVTEWYVNGPLGLEQGFTLNTDPGCGKRSIELTVRMDGALSVDLARDTRTLLLRNAEERVVARYRDLYVVDAIGRELPASLGVEGNVVRIRVGAEGAIFPVRIDPLVAVEQGTLLPSGDQSSYPFLGASVAISGNTAVVAGAPAVVFERTDGEWVESAKLTTSDGSIGLGIVAMSGDTIVGHAAAVYVFEKSGGEWAEQAKLLPTDGTTSTGFGTALAIVGDTIVVGDSSDGELGELAGAAYVFARDGRGWTQQTKLLASDGHGWDGNVPAHEFGRSVAVDGDTAVVGAPGWTQENSSMWDGATYVFEREGITWTEEAKIVASGIDVGRQVAVSADTLLIDGGLSAHVFHRSNGVWSEEAQFVPSEGPGQTWVKSHVALQDDLAVISTDALHAGEGDARAPETGAVYLYQRVGGVWGEEQKIVPLAGLFPDSMGQGPPVGISEDTVLVGATRNDFMGTPAVAYAFILRLSNGTPCADGAECGSGFCVDGVCCDSPCDAGLCEACAVATGASNDGTCSGLTGAACDDGNACTQVDLCDVGACVGTAPLPCPSKEECHDVGTCDSSTGECDGDPSPDGTPCSEGVCRGGRCVATSTAPPYVVGGGCACRAGHGAGGVPGTVLLILLVGTLARRRRITASVGPIASTPECERAAARESLREGDCQSRCAANEEQPRALRALRLPGARRRRM